ncbi:MAG: acyltransferase [Beggiatoa sp. IS2]|nr:MAG: acyltransferase [Beggiatoa sp. IS2]
MYRVAAIQMASGPTVEANLQEVARLLSQAVREGAQLVVLPESFALMSHNLEDNLLFCEQWGQGLLQSFLSQQAQHHGIWLIGGTVPLVAATAHKFRSACLVFDNTGLCVARYDKIHLFDVTLSPEEHYTESSVIEAGSQVTTVTTPLGRVGLAICYDLRFPELFRCLLTEGMEIIALPAAFTAVTGEAHWEVLLRARAIENLSYLIAANQVSQPDQKRKTFGHSMIIDPWGKILAGLPQGNGIIYANLEVEHLSSLRQHFPSIHHRKIQCR